jgi:hypothetical protein
VGVTHDHHDLCVKRLIKCLVDSQIDSQKIYVSV